MNKTKIIFLELLRAGLWDSELDLELFKGDVDWKAVADLAMKQTVTGIVTDGVVKLPAELRPAKNIYFNLIFRVKEIEESNTKMNRAVPKIINILKKNGCDTLLQKGQGVAMNYRNPLHRISGDIDLFVGFDEKNYEKADKVICGFTSHVGHNNRKRRHAEYHLGKIPLEIHGNIDCSINKLCDSRVADWAKKRLNGEGPVLHVNDTDVILAPYNYDVLYIFIHMLNHYMEGGVGLRQVSDWMMYIDKNIDKIDLTILEEDIAWLGIDTYWKMFAAMSVKFLGFQKDKMPFYDPAYEKKCGGVLSHIFKTGNFGALQKEKQLSEGSNTLLKKAVTFIGQIPVYADNMRMFPHDAWYCFRKFVKGGFGSVVD